MPIRISFHATPLICLMAICILSQHIDCLVNYIWQKHGDFLAKRRVTFVDSMFTSMLSNKFLSFTQHNDCATYKWNALLVAYVSGVVDGRSSQLQWLKDVDLVYVPMNWGKKHWVALAIDLPTGHIDILDPFQDLTSARKVVSYMNPIVQMLPPLLRSVCSEVPSSWPASGFSFLRIPGVAQNSRGGDCGPLAIKFMELHSHHLSVPLRQLTVQQVDNLRLHYAIDLYSTYVSSL